MQGEGGQQEGEEGKLGWAGQNLTTNDSANAAEPTKLGAPCLNLTTPVHLLTPVFVLFYSVTILHYFSSASSHIHALAVSRSHELNAARVPWPAITPAATSRCPMSILRPAAPILYRMEGSPTGADTKWRSSETALNRGLSPDTSTLHPANPVSVTSTRILAAESKMRRTKNVVRVSSALSSSHLPYR